MLRGIPSQRGGHGSVDYSRAYQAKEQGLCCSCANFVSSHPGELWKDLGDSGNICEALNATNRAKLKEITAKESHMKYLIALSETYSNVTSGNMRKQVLSIMADLTTFEEIRKFMPGLTKYMFCEAEKHRLLSGRGAPIVSKSGPRCKIDLNELEYFLTFITSPYIIQDLPFGEKFLILLLEPKKKKIKSCNDVNIEFLGYRTNVDNCVKIVIIFAPCALLTNNSAWVNAGVRCSAGSEACRHYCVYMTS